MTMNFPVLSLLRRVGRLVMFHHSPTRLPCARRLVEIFLYALTLFGQAK